MLPTLATKSDVEALRADLHKWMVGSMIGLFIGFGGLAALAQLLSPPATPAPVVLQAQPQAAPVQSTQTPQPIVIYVSPPKQ